MSTLQQLDSDRSAVKKALMSLTVRILKPLVRILLRHGMSCQEFEETSRWVYVDVAMNDAEFNLEGRKQSKSRVAVLTGLSRKEVLRLTKSASPEENDELTTYNRAARVLTGWAENDAFLDADGRPRELPIKGETPSFADLVRLYSGDVPHRAILEELKRCEAVDLRGERVRLRQFAYFPSSGTDEELEVVATCATDLLRTMDHNVSPGSEERYPQCEAYSSLIPRDRVPEVRDRIRQRIRDTAREIQHYLYEVQDDVKRSGIDYSRAGIGLYYFQ